MASPSLDFQTSLPFYQQNGHGKTITNAERHSLLIKSFLTTVGSDVLRALLTETAEEAYGSLEDFLIQHQTNIIYVLQQRMRNQLILVYPPDDTDIDLKQWNCRLLCLMLRATDCLESNLVSDINVIERAYTQHAKCDIKASRRSASSYGKQSQPKKEWHKVCVAVQRLAGHLNDTRLLSSVRNFICRVEMGSKLMDARIETHLSLTKMISELAASHSGRFSNDDFKGQLGDLAKLKQQYDMVSKPSFSDSRSSNTLSRTMAVDVEPTRPLSASDKPSRTTSAIVISPAEENGKHNSDQIQKSNSSELIHNQSHFCKQTPHKRHRPFSNTSLGSQPSRTVKLVTPKMSLTRKNHEQNYESDSDVNDTVDPKNEQILPNTEDSIDIDHVSAKETVKTNKSISMKSDRQPKSDNIVSKSGDKVPDACVSKGQLSRSSGENTSPRLRSFDMTRSASQIKPRVSKSNEEPNHENSIAVSNGDQTDILKTSTKERTNDIVHIYSQSLKLPPRKRDQKDKGEKKQPSSPIPKMSVESSIAQKKDDAMQLIQQTTYSSVVAYTTKYSRSILKKKHIPRTTPVSENIDIKGDEIDDKTLQDDDQKDDKEDDKIIETPKSIEIDNKEIVEKLQTRRKSTFGRLKGMLKSAILPNKPSSESTSSNNSTANLPATQNPKDSFPYTASNTTGTIAQVVLKTLPALNQEGTAKKDEPDKDRTDKRGARDQNSWGDESTRNLQKDGSLDFKQEDVADGRPVKELKKSTRVKFTPGVENFDNATQPTDNRSFDDNRRRRQSLPLLANYKTIDMLLKNNSKSQSNVVPFTKSVSTPPTQRRASIATPSARELSKTDTSTSRRVNGSSNHLETQLNNINIAVDEENNQDNPVEGETATSAKRKEYSQKEMDNFTQSSDKKMKFKPDLDGLRFGKDSSDRYQNLSKRRQSIAVSRLSSSMRVGNTMIQPTIIRSNSESELKTEKPSEPLQKITQTADRAKLQETEPKYKNKSSVLDSVKSEEQSKETAVIHPVSETTLKLKESKSPNLATRRKSIMVSSQRERNNEHKKEFVRAKSESEFDLTALKEASMKKDTEGFKNNAINGMDTKKPKEKVKAKQNRKSMLDATVLYEEEEGSTTSDGSKQNNEPKDDKPREQGKNLTQTSILDQQAIHKPAKAKADNTENDVANSTKENDVIEPDPESEMKRIANDVIVHQQVHKAAREFMDKDKQFVDEFFTFLHKYQATKEFLKTEQYSPFKTMKLPNGIKAALSFLHAYTFRHVNVFDRDKCNYVVEKILKRTECDDAKRLQKQKQDVVDKIKNEKRLERRNTSTSLDKVTSKSKGESAKGTAKDIFQNRTDKIHNSRIESHIKSLQTLEVCKCWKCHQKDLAMTIAVNWRNHGICEMLLKYGVEFKIEHLLPAVRANDAENVKDIVSFLKKKYAWNPKHEEARMALILARFHSMQDIVAFLEKEGVQDERVVQCTCFA